MALEWYTSVIIDGIETTPTEWIRDHYREYSTGGAAEILSTLGVGTITGNGVRSHLRDKYRLKYGQGRRPPVAGSPGALSEDRMTVCGIQTQAVIAYLRQARVATLRQMSENFDRSEATVEQMIAEMRQAGFGIVREEQRIVLPETPLVDYQIAPLFESGETVEVSFAIISDTHGGSHFEQVTALRDFVHIAREEYGVRHVLHTGDAFAGLDVYRGQRAELYAVNAGEQAEVVANNLPAYSDLRYYLLGGNHDYSYFKSVGLDVRELLLSRGSDGQGRGDVVLLPYDAADVPLLPGIDARLWHPSGGPAYALSYRGQKYASQLAFDELMAITVGEKPIPTIRLALIGHFHTCFMFDQGPIVVLGTMCFEGQNSYLKRKGLVPYIGGWVVQCRFVDGFLHRLVPVRIRYREIEDDWRGWWAKRQAKQREVTKLEPIFSLDEGED
jgi:hypothetical protein